MKRTILVISCLLMVFTAIVFMGFKCNLVRSLIKRAVVNFALQIGDYQDIYAMKAKLSPFVSGIERDDILIYEGDTTSVSNFLCNAVICDDGIVIGARSGGTIVSIDEAGNEVELLSVKGCSDWRGVWMDSHGNIFVSPYDSADNSMHMRDDAYGIYKLSREGRDIKGKKFVKVHNLPAHNTIWTFCEDDKGFIYAGNYTCISDRPIIYKSTDGGETFFELLDFNVVGLTVGGRHIHSVIWNKYNNSLYAIVGEVNTVFKSTDGGASWQNLNISLNAKGSSMIAVERGVLIGSDGAYFCDIDILRPDDRCHRRVSRIWANTVFAIRESGLTGNLYAFCKIDSSVLCSEYMPQIDNNEEAVQNYVSSHIGTEWYKYYMATKDIYPEDCVRPTHFAILCSSDRGESWHVLYRGKATSNGPEGFWTIGYFRNGEVLAGRVITKDKGNRHFVNPIVISEGKHKFVGDLRDVTNEFFARTLKDNHVKPIK